LFVNNPTNAGGGTISNFYGVYISNPTTATTGYGLYSLATTNYLSGNLGINTTTPSAPLEVNGKAKFDNTVTFTASQTFPGTVTGVTTGGGLVETGTTVGLIKTCSTGQLLSWSGSAWVCSTAAGTGTVTSVGSGAGLTGGPITTSGTLSIASAGVTDTMLAKAYSGTGSCASGSFVTALNRASAPTCATGAGGGTITGVTAGTDLTGGGTSGTVTLNVDTTKVPQLATNNSFTGNISIVDPTVGDTGLSVQTTDTSAANTAISGLADGSAGTGVYGEAENGSLATAVWGVSSSGLAGLFSGDVSVTGNLSKSGGSFKIDDPIDPANKYLYHSFVESPDMKNVYDGVAVLDAKGEVVVQLPEWFGALNSDFRYQLTCIGGFAPVYIAEEVTQNHFKIAGGKPGMKVSWMVTGIRQDAWAQAHRIPVEVEKPAGERGYYIHPELFGQPAQKNIERVEHPAAMPKTEPRSSQQ